MTLHPNAAAPPKALIRYLDVALVLVAAPIALGLGAPVLGYCVGAGAWLALRAAGVPLERQATNSPTATGAVGLRLGFLMARLIALAVAVVVVRATQGRDDGLTTLLVIVAAYTVFMATSFADRPKRGAR